MESAFALPFTKARGRYFFEFLRVSSPPKKDCWRKRGREGERERSSPSFFSRRAIKVSCLEIIRRGYHDDGRRRNFSPFSNHKKKTRLIQSKLLPLPPKIPNIRNTKIIHILRPLKKPSPLPRYVRTGHRKTKLIQSTNPFTAPSPAKQKPAKINPIQSNHHPPKKKKEQYTTHTLLFHPLSLSLSRTLIELPVKQ